MTQKIVRFAISIENKVFQENTVGFLIAVVMGGRAIDSKDMLTPAAAMLGGSGSHLHIVPQLKVSMIGHDV